MDDQLDQTHESLGISTSFLCIVSLFFFPIQPHLEIGYIHSILWKITCFLLSVVNDQISYCLSAAFIHFDGCEIDSF